jgi:hypothetical protein
VADLLAQILPFAKVYASLYLLAMAVALVFIVWLMISVLRK